VRDIGLHLRLTHSLLELAQRAVDFKLPIFQCFFLHQDTNRFIQPTQNEIDQFIIMRDNFKKLFVHSSYWTNLASIKSISLRTIKKELHLAKQLGFTHLIVHPGCAKGAQDIDEGIDALVRRLNKMLKHEHDIQIVLENTAHGKLSVGSNLDDFKTILEKIDYPEKISFCIDTVHAHSYGYNIADITEQQHFFAKINNTIGFERIALIHLNNTCAGVGSCIDRHELLPDGVIHLDALKQFILNADIAHIPVIMELPATAPEIEKEHIDLVRCWHQ
jgi:deoxyribonuclease-4